MAKNKKNKKKVKDTVRVPLVRRACGVQNKYAWGGYNTYADR
jgi:hypothetical protein